MSKTYYKYKVHCTTENTNKYWILESTNTAPTTCPSNTSHSVNTNLTEIETVIADNIVTVKEELVATGGNFGCKSIKINAIKNTATSVTTFFPYHISALAVRFVSKTEHQGDTIDLKVGENTIIGAITANVSPASAWTSQNYTIGQIVTYTHPIFGSRVYTCIQNTVSNEVPTNSTYWRHGFELSVASTVVNNAYVGYYIKLDDGTNINDVKRIISVDKTNNKIYVESNLTDSFLASTPTYIKQTVYMINDYEIGPTWEYTIGLSKIGGSYIPKDTIITIEYTNYSVDTDKVLIGYVEYLY